ncbi:MAG: hypothetical protein IGQ88_09995 [Gloeomargaritaceae cyanobacterium C42_A2020_066]|nr:hypothetical protein [Gloeomargaritaceae cyanobacterium C42_A2020_066]
MAWSSLTWLGFYGLGLLGLALVAAQGQAQRQQTQLSTPRTTVSAQVFYQPGPELRDLRLQIQRAGRPAMILPFPAAMRVRAVDITAIDLDGDQEPELLLDVAEPGADCCSHTFIYYWMAEEEGYEAFHQFWGHHVSGYRPAGFAGPTQLRPWGAGPSLYFMGRDDRFQETVIPRGADLGPVQIWAWQSRTLAEVTPQFPGATQASATRHWQAFQRYRRAGQRELAQAALAAYAADRTRLGDDRIWPQVEANLGRPAVERLKAQLQAWGYRPTPPGGISPNPGR